MMTLESETPGPYRQLETLLGSLDAQDFNVLVSSLTDDADWMIAKLQTGLEDHSAYRRFFHKMSGFAMQFGLNACVRIARDALHCVDEDRSKLKSSALTELLAVRRALVSLSEARNG
jgi:hypothetical protein